MFSGKACFHQLYSCLLAKESFFTVTLFLNWISVISRNHINSAAATNFQIVSYLLHIKGSAMLSSQLVAGLGSVFFWNYIPAWVIVLLKFSDYFLSLLSRLPLFSVSSAWWGEGHNFFCLFHTLACFHTYFKVLPPVSNFLPGLPVCMAPDLLNFSKVYLHTGLRMCI